MTRYELLDRIGVGGMAEIFRGKAVAAGGFEKPVAIKRILPHLSQDPRFVELLIAEAKVLSLLKHRNIVQIFDVGLGDDQQYFLVMEYVDGKDLGAIQRGLETRRKRMPFDLALHVGAEICEALEHAHSAKAPDGKLMSLVHRDVSPSNVLLSRAGEIKLTDFGIAKRAEQEQTSGGAVKGKFAYISPEQARNEQVDPRSDVFSVGILLWELICGRRLFSGLPDMEALRGVRDPTKIQRPSEIDPRLSKELDALVMSALDPERIRRPTAGMLAAKLRSMRYSLDDTVGDPATELAKIIDAAEQVEKQSQPVAVQPAPQRPGLSGFEDIGEATVIRIRTADAFSARDKDGGVAAAREIIDRFEEEETRLAQLTGDQLRQLRSGARDEPSDVAPIPRKPDKRGRPPTDEPTMARMPIDDDVPTFAATSQSVRDLPPNRSLDSDEHTRLVAPRDRRTPLPERVPRAATNPPPMARQPGRASQPNLPLAPQPMQPAQNPIPNAGAWNAQPQMNPGMGQPTPPSQPKWGQPGYQPPGQAMAQASAQPGMNPGSQPGWGQPGQQPGMGQPGMMQPQMGQTMGQPMGQPNPGSQPGWGQPNMQPPMNPGMQQPQYGTQTPNPYPDWSGGNAPVMNPNMQYPGGAPPSRPSMPQVVGFGKPKKGGLKPWMLIVGALIVAGLAFAITRAFIGGTPPIKPVAPVAPQK